MKGPPPSGDRSRGGGGEEITLSSPAARAVLRGHPWVFREAIVRGGNGLEVGAVATMLDPTGRPLGRGLWDPVSPIAVRVFSLVPDEQLDVALIASRLERAFSLRQRWFASGETTAYRLCHGEGDRVPGLVIDRYEHVAVVRVDGDAMQAWKERLLPRATPLLQALGVRTIVRRLPRPETGAPGARDEGEAKIAVVSGPQPPSKIAVRENGAAMVVDLAHGQKTGAFLDQRDNRQRVREMAVGKSVLNLFSYAGGFSTASILGGATRVTSVDLAHQAHATAQESMRLNGIDPSRHAFVTADVFTFLEGARRRGDRWDLVISDPPSFAPSERARERAMASYRKLHAASAAVLADGGVLCAASCSSHITAEDFLTTLDDESVQRRDLRVQGLFGPPCDHPVVAGWPEGRYLKFAVLS